MSKEITEKFVDALGRLERDGDVNEIAGLFAEGSEIGNATLTESMSGPEGAREFWSHYRQTLGNVTSDFKNKIITDDSAALEWTTTGITQDGREINYDGVSIIETDGELITRFFAYFDPKKLGEELDGKAHRG